MRPLLALAAGVILSLASCSADDPAPSEPEGATTPATTTTTQSTTSSPSTSPTTSEPTTSETAPAPAVVPDNAGTSATRSIWAPPGQGIQCPGTDAFVWDYADCNPSNGVIDPDEFYGMYGPQNQQPEHDGVPIADGGTCPAYLCGYGHDEQGNRNPSSGEIQTQHGCEQGYITDVELCAAVGSPIQ